jgi:hypothetical protein
VYGTIKEVTVKRYHYSSHDELQGTYANLPVAYTSPAAKDLEGLHTL